MHSSLAELPKAVIAKLQRRYVHPLASSKSKNRTRPSGGAESRKKSAKSRKPTEVGDTAKAVAMPPSKAAPDQTGNGKSSKVKTEKSEATLPLSETCDSKKANDSSPSPSSNVGTAKSQRIHVSTPSIAVSADPKESRTDSGAVKSASAKDADAAAPLMGDLLSPSMAAIPEPASSVTALSESENDDLSSP